MPTTTAAPLAPATIGVTVLLNATVDVMDDGRRIPAYCRPCGAQYRPGDTLAKIGTIAVPAPADGNADTILETAYDLLNVGATGEAARYRAARNRSLSTGDVLVIDGVAFAVAAYGFDRVTVDPADVDRTNGPADYYGIGVMAP